MDMTKEDANPYSWKPPAKEGRQKVVLLVEDEPATLRFYQAGLKGLSGWRQVVAENGERALEVLRHESVDVLVTDLNMPVMDGYKLITTVHDLYPSIPVIVLTALPPGAPQDRAMELGALRVLSKPTRLSLLMEEIKQLGNRESAGFVRGITLSGLLQLMSWEGKTCTLSVRSRKAFGHLYFANGKLIHALCGHEEGLEAAYRILAWPQPQVEFVEACRVARTINMPTEEILMNLAILQDHRQAAEEHQDPWEGELS